MDSYAYGIIFAFGAVIGSFLNVVVYRYNTGLPLLRSRSMCFSCGKKLAWYELVPLVSFLVQRGACRSCKSLISRQYIAVEFLTGALFALSAFFLLPENASYGDILSLFYYWIILSLLTVIAVYDMRHKIIPDGIVYAFIALSLAAFFVPGGPELGARDMLAAPVLFAPFAFLWAVSRGAWMGLGDAKLAWGMGWLLGLLPGISAVVIGFWIGAIVGLGIMLFDFVSAAVLGRRGGARLTMKSEIPFGPFLVLGTVLVLFFDVNVFSLSVS